MEEQKKKSTTIENDKEIVFSKAIKAGKRIYYLDVKKNRKDEMFIAITESKKVVSLDKDDPQVNFEKHKIFLYKEDFENSCMACSKLSTSLPMNKVSFTLKAILKPQPLKTLRNNLAK